MDIEQAYCLISVNYPIFNQYCMMKWLNVYALPVITV